MNGNGLWIFYDYILVIVLYMLYPVYLKTVVRKPIDPKTVWKIALINSLVVGAIFIGAKYLLRYDPIFDTRPLLFYFIVSVYLKFEGKKAEFTLKEDPNEEEHDH